jgi:adenosylhomocysteine nucleosidase
MDAKSNQLEATRTVPAPFGVFTALAWEGAAVRAVLRQVKRERAGLWRGRAGRRAVLVVTGGVGPERAQRTLQQFAEVPFAAVLSVGCAGALIPGLAPGHLILASDVRMRSGETEAPLARFLADARLLAHARAAAAQAGIPTAEGALFTSTRVLATPEVKAQEGRVTGAIAVEMESGIHAAFARARGLPFLALRVIFDPVEMTLPAVSRFMSPDGRVRPFKAATYAVTHPQHIGVLLMLKRTQTMAAQALRRLCHVLFPLLETF